MIRYPSPADLAAFRYRIAHATSGLWPVDPPADTPRRYDDRARVLHTDPLAAPVSGAWSEELRHGIGRPDWRTAVLRHPAGMLAAATGEHHAIARREAAAMRSRTFEAIRADALGDAGLAVDMEAAMQTFEPCPHCTGGGIGCCASVVESITR